MRLTRLAPAIAEYGFIAVKTISSEGKRQIMWLVTHASSAVGRAVVQAAAAEGRELRLLVRDVTQLPADLKGYQALQVAYTDQSQLEQAFAGVSHVVLITPLDGQMGEWHEALARAARAAGVKHVVQITGLGADPRSQIRRLRWLGEAEARVAAVGLKPWVLRPAVAMQSLLKHNPEIGAGGSLEAPFRRAKMPLVDARDVAQVALRVLESDEPPRALELSGTKPLDYFEIARECSRACGQRIEYLDICSPKARGSLEARGLSPRLIEALIEFWDYAAAGMVPLPITDDIERVLGRPPRSLCDFLKAEKPAQRACR
jgi:uncharacterized protein YbjT (DUF2867 family)